MRVTEGCKESVFAESPYMEMVWACFMQMVSFVHMSALLEHSRFTNTK